MRRLLVALVVSALVLGLTSAGAIAAIVHHAELKPAFRSDRDNDLLTILAIGSDIGPPYRPGDPRRGRADAVQLVAIDTKVQRATIVSLPRDSYIGGDKLTHHLFRGGPERMVAVMESYTGVPIDHYVLMSFRSFEDAVDGVGGAEIVIDRPMVDRNSKSNFRETGPQRVDGEAALAFVRNRGSMPDGDFGRTRNQGSFLRYMHRELRRQEPDLVELTEFAALFARTTVSDIPPDRILPLAMLALQIHPDQILHVPLRGGLGTAGGASIVRLNPGNAFDRIARGRAGP